MKKEISALELAYLIKEFQTLRDAKINSIFQPEKREVLLQLFVPGKGKKILRILPNFIYLTTEKTPTEKSHGFCMALRKYLTNARLRKVQQVGSERVIEFYFETKEKKFILITELFSKGNIILCTEKYKILNLIESHTWKDRELKVGLIYTAPKKDINFFDLSISSLKKILQSEKSLVKKLASDLGLGGVYAEEICLLTTLDKTQTMIKEKDVATILNTINKLTSKKTEALVVYQGKEIVDVVPFPLKFYEGLETKKFDDYNSALYFVLGTQLKSQLEIQKTAEHEKKITKINNVIKKQEERIEEIQKTIEQTEHKAEALYTHYKLVQEILEELKKARKKILLGGH